MLAALISTAILTPILALSGLLQARRFAASDGETASPASVLSPEPPMIGRQGRPVSSVVYQAPEPGDRVMNVVLHQQAIGLAQRVVEEVEKMHATRKL